MRIRRSSAIDGEPNQGKGIPWEYSTALSH